MRMIKVRRRPYVREGRIKVKGTVFKTPDRGKPFKTPLAKQWSRKVIVPPLHAIHGYKVAYPVMRRQRALTHEVIQRKGGRKGTLSTFRTLNYLRNLSADRKADAVFKQDANWVGRKYKYKVK